MEVVPYKEDSLRKKDQVARMFNTISGKYDFLNHFLSFRTDIRWRKKAIKLLKPEKPKLILDIATGTADFAIEALSLQPNKIIGVDISEGMLAIGRKKIKALKLEDKIELKWGDSENLTFEDNKFDAVIVSFGVRNFEDLERGLSNMYRVLKSTGTLLILEFSKPKKFPVQQMYNLYFKKILPFVGRMISKDRSAYSYLPESVQKFPEGERLLHILKKIGFIRTKCIPLTFGISSIYIAKK